MAMAIMSERVYILHLRSLQSIHPLRLLTGEDSSTNDLSAAMPRAGGCLVLSPHSLQLLPL